MAAVKITASNYYCKQSLASCVTKITILSSLVDTLPICLQDGMTLTYNHPLQYHNTLHTLSWTPLESTSVKNTFRCWILLDYLKKVWIMTLTGILPLIISLNWKYNRFIYFIFKYLHNMYVHLKLVLKNKKQ